MALIVVLVVDDEPSIVELLTEILEEEGYKVVGARDGREAFAIAVLLLPDIVLTDIAMPFVNGSELRDRLHADARTCRTPVILMSAGPRPRPWGDNAPAFLAKPFDLAHVVRALARCAVA